MRDERADRTDASDKPEPDALERSRREHLESYLRQVDRSAMDELENRYGHLVPEPLMRGVREQPLSLDDRAEFETALGVPSENERGERYVGFSEGPNRPAHINLEHLQIPKTIYHERIHQLSHPAARRLLGDDLYEGLTEHYAIGGLGTETPEGQAISYGEQRADAQRLESVCGREALERAYFAGDDRELRAALERAMGETDPRRLDERTRRLEANA